MSVPDAEVECKTKPAGNGYRGTQSTAVSGASCIPWTSVENASLVSSLSGNDVIASSNYCRRMARSVWPSVTCFTQFDGRVQIEQPCDDIKFCRQHLCIVLSIHIYSFTIYSNKNHIFTMLTVLMSFLTLNLDTTVVSS